MKGCVEGSEVMFSCFLSNREEYTVPSEERFTDVLEELRPGSMDGVSFNAFRILAASTLLLMNAKERNIHSRLFS